MPLPALTKIRQRWLTVAFGAFALVCAACATAAAPQQDDHTDARPINRQEESDRIDASSPVHLEHKLKRGARLTGRLTTKEGTPVANAQVAMLSSDGDRYVFVVVDGKLNDHHLITGKTETAADGSFTLLASSAKATLLALADNGYATASYTPENTEPLHLTLTPWGQISGTLTRNSEASARGQTLFSTSSSPESNGVRIRFRSNAMTDANGKFHLLKVAAGENTLRYIHTLPAAEPSELNFSGPSLITTVKPGEQSILNYDGRGMLVTGELGLGAMGKDYQWGVGSAFLTAMEPLEALKNTPNTGPTSYIFNIAKDGTFHIDGVLPGVYNIYIVLHSPSESTLAAANAIADTTVTIPAGKTGEVVNIGVIEMRPKEDVSASSGNTERN